MKAPLELDRRSILAYRQQVGALAERLPCGKRSLRRIAWCGLQDSVPRAALLSIHARIRGASSSSWEDPALVQVWGPRFSVYAVATEDRGLFTVARLPESGAARERAETIFARLEALLGGGRLRDREIGEALGVDSNLLRYSALTGRVLIRWDGARAPELWIVPAPHVDPDRACRELAKRHLHILGPTTPEAFGRWAGIRSRGEAVFKALRRSLAPVRTPQGEAWILRADEPAFRAARTLATGTRFLPSGDAYLLAGDRELLVADAARGRELWPPATVWPGGLLVDGELVGTWRRSQERVSIRPWRTLTKAKRAETEAEAAALPLPDLKKSITVIWEDRK
ncbi:MAG: winged helix DNA-binding domain-containing protein [Candidatus Latescibacteria bacterium]|nr:winged helix DNA-binding domain-containing protein [bacterium]MCB9514015.1 winged helix DNA-binding domain-containing protein [Candidatus Latescibacterota bacterium]